MPRGFFFIIFVFSWFRPKIENFQTTAGTIAHARVSEKKSENDRIHQKVIILQCQIASFVTKEFAGFPHPKILKSLKLFSGKLGGPLLLAKWKFRAQVTIFGKYCTQYVIIQRNTKQYNTTQCHTIPYDTIQYNTIQYDAIQYNKMQHDTRRYKSVNQK